MRYTDMPTMGDDTAGEIFTLVRLGLRVEQVSGAVVLVMLVDEPDEPRPDSCDSRLLLHS